MEAEFHRRDWPYRSAFSIAYKTQTHACTVVVQLKEGSVIGRGEALGVSYHGETADSVLEQLNTVRSQLSDGLTRRELQELLPPGGARNAVDCALWDLEAKRLGSRVWELAGIPSVGVLKTDYTLGVDMPDSMGRAAAAVPQYSVLKVKLNGEGDLERVEAVRAARPNAEIIVDANQAWSEQQLVAFTPRLAELGVRLIEQPLPMGQDAALVGFDSPVPLCADESCQTTQSLAAIVGKYQYINIKLDKTGGLTEALRVVRAARGQGLKLMVGCMGGTSLSMAPAFVIGQFCDFIDLDGPLLIRGDVPFPIQYDGERMSAPPPGLWG